jgi:hypothetical protein
MPLPIKDTPILTGEDAVNFLRQMQEVNEGKHAISKEEYQRAQDTYNRIMRKTQIMGWACEYIVHIPCHDESEGSSKIGFMIELYENPDNDKEITGFKCEDCGYIVDIVPRGRPF